MYIQMLSLVARGPFRRWSAVQAVIEYTLSSHIWAVQRYSSTITRNKLHSQRRPRMPYYADYVILVQIKRGRGPAAVGLRPLIAGIAIGRVSSQIGSWNKEFKVRLLSISDNLFEY